MRRECKRWHDGGVMHCCHRCQRVLIYGWLRAELADHRRYEERDIRACSVTCCEQLGRMDGLVKAWRYEAAAEKERRTA